MDDSPRKRYEQLQEILQEALLRDYPNPERKGCPGESVLRELANRERPIRDAHWEHVTHCSPCYREFLDLRAHVYRRQDRRAVNIRWALVAAAIIVVVGLTAVLMLRSRPQQQIVTRQPAPAKPVQPTEPAVVASVFNMENSPTRGENQAETPVGEIQRLQRRRLALSVYLPFGSEPGAYEFQLRRSKDDLVPVASYTGTATIEDGLTVLRVAPDLSNVPPGLYVVAIRRAGGRAWQYSKAHLG